MSYICAKLCQSQDAKSGRGEESRAEKPWRAQIWQVLFAQPVSHAESIPQDAVQATPESPRAIITPARGDLACTELSWLSAVMTAFVNNQQELPAESWL